MFGKSNFLLVLACLLGILFPLGINAQNDPTKGNVGAITPHAIVVGIILIITGLIYCFYGRRYYRLTLFLIGFYIGAIVTWIALTNGEPKEGFAGAASVTIILIVSLAVGFIVGLLFLCCSTVAIWLLGALAGYAFALFILAWRNDGLIQSKPGRIIFIVVLTLLGLLACFFKTTLIILSTAFIGAYAIILGIDMFARTGFAQSIRAFVVNHGDDHYETNTKIYLMLAGMVAFFILGSLYQYRYHRNHAFGDGRTAPETGKKKFKLPLPWKRV